MNTIFYVYILKSSYHSRFYIGQTDDIINRIVRHNSGGVKSTKPYAPWELVGVLEKNNRSEAIILERKLKNLNSEGLKRFIKKYFNK